MDCKEEPNQMNATLKFSYGGKSIVNTKLIPRRVENDNEEFKVESIESSSLGLDEI